MSGGNGRVGRQTSHGGWHDGPAYTELDQGYPQESKIALISWIRGPSTVTIRRIPVFLGLLVDCMIRSPFP
jgi:hypothetical protein